MSSTQWAQALDGLEWCIDEQRDLVARGLLDQVVGFRPGPDLGPLPEELLDRAHGLLEACRRLEAEVELELGGLARARGVVDRFAADHVEGRRPAYFDQPL
jgi:hypothetical protein